MAMTNSDAMRILKALRDRLDQFRKEVKRKHWKPSEKAMAAAKYQMEIDALSKALICMAAKDLNESRRSENQGYASEALDLLERKE